MVDGEEELHVGGRVARQVGGRQPGRGGGAFRVAERVPFPDPE